MTTLHMETESVRAVAKQMTQNGGQAAMALHLLGRSVQSLQATWEGASSDQLVMESQEILRRLNSQVDLLLELAARVEREADEWEQADRNGFTGMHNALTYGQGLFNIPSNILPAITIPAISSVLVGLPPWLTAWLDRFFQRVPVTLPVVDEPVPPPLTSTTESTTPRSKLGELLDKAEQEQRQKPAEAPQEKAVEAPKPAHISDYPARPDDGTYLIGQEKGDSCSMASTRMALERAGIDVSESDLRDTSKTMDGGYQNNVGKWGTTPSSLDNLINEKYGDRASAEYTNSQSVTDIQNAANDGKGIVVSVKNSEWFGSAQAHSVTVVGVTNENGKQVVLVNDPWPPGQGKRLSIEIKDFENAWYGDALYISPKKQE